MSSGGSAAAAVRGRWDARGLHVAVLVARFHTEVTERLLRGALACLEEHGAEAGAAEVCWVPGAWELPQAAARLADANRHDAIVTLGCVVRGETPHFDHVCSQVSLGLGAVARASRAPILFGVLTTDTLEQARARAGDDASNKGYEAALAALEMVALYRALDRP